MPRPPRLFVPDVPVHILQRGNDRAPMFHDVQDYETFRHCLLMATDRFGVRVHAYVLMTNHIHLLVTPSLTESVPRTMHWASSVYVQHINILYRRTGSRLEGRYRVRTIADETHVLRCMRYIEENPVRAQMVAAADDYAWSSHAANAHGRRDSLVRPHPAYDALGATWPERWEAYRALFVTRVRECDADTVRIVRKRPGKAKRDARAASPSVEQGRPRACDRRDEPALDEA